MAKSSTSAADDTGRAYLRLMRYALRHRFRIALMMFFSLLVGVSLSSMILAAGFAMNVLFSSPERFADFTNKAEEHVRTGIEGVHHFVESSHLSGVVKPIESAIGLDPVKVPDQARRLLESMYDNKRSALLYICAAMIAF